MRNGTDMGLKCGTEQNGYGVKMRNGTDMGLKCGTDMGSKRNLKFRQPRTQGICSWGAKYPGMAWSRDPRILRKMAYCLLGLGE